jgi:CheY-like chemotaxis protein
MTTRKILIVEDEPSVALTFEHLLRKSLEYNYQVESVASAEAAMETIKKGGGRDVILLDYFLPGMNGAEFLKSIRSEDQETVVIVISASQDYKIVHDVFKLGADDFVTKEELTNPYVLEKSILAGLEKREYQHEISRQEISRQRQDAITTVVRTVHHELNNPMAIVTLTASKLAASQKVADKKLKDDLEQIQQAVERMSEIMKRLPHLREETYNEELRGLKLYAIPSKDKKPR